MSFHIFAISLALFFDMKDTIDITCRDGNRSQVVIGTLADELPALLPADGSRTIIITDAKVHANNLEFVNRYDHIIIGQGESAKTIVKLEEIYRQLLAMEADRSTFILGMGGGIVTDMTGFVASTYMRGVRFAFLPTTLLAQVDASVGGKNGVNLDGYKNIVGVFNQPAFVLCDTELLASLPDREFRAGIAEVIKAAVVGDPELFAILEHHPFEEIRSDRDLLREIIVRSIKVKTAIVERDLCERNERRKLNLGHTFAHAIERNFATMSHGEAVAVGMAVICDAAVRKGLLGAETAERIKSLISKMGLPTVPPVEMRILLNTTRADKKREGKGIYLVFPRAIGECTVTNVDMDSLEEIFNVPKKGKPQEAAQDVSRADADTATAECPLRRYS